MDTSTFSGDFNDLVMGIHSIREAVLNPKREKLKIIGTESGLKDLTKGMSRAFKERVSSNCETLPLHGVQETAKKLCTSMGFNFSRVPSQVFMITVSQGTYSVGQAFREIEKRDEAKIICLDSVTDAHNAAAILRTASFYGVSFVVTSAKGAFGKGPTFSRIASGALEHIKIVRTSSLPKFIRTLGDKGIGCIGLTEHADLSLEDASKEYLENSKMCLVFGSEDRGLSNAVLRVLPKKISLKSSGMIKSLNVSVATAISMEKIFVK